MASEAVALSGNEQTPPPPAPVGRSRERPTKKEVEWETGIYVSCNISGASIYLDGEYKGTTPLLITGMEPGKYRLEVTKSHYSTDTSYVYLNEGNVREARCYLEKISGFLSVDSNPSGASIYCDGNLMSSRYIELDEGKHTVSAKKFGYNTRTETVYIKRNMESYATLELTEAAFEITYAAAERNVFNPKNHGVLGSMVMDFSVTAPGSGIVEISDETGRVVYSENISFYSWNQSMEWIGTDFQDLIVEDGVYTATLRVNDITDSFKFSVDSSIIYPMHTITPDGLGIGSVASAKLYPKSSFLLNVKGGVDFLSSGTPFYDVPMNLGIAWTPTNFLEFTGSLNGNVSKDNFNFGFNATLKLCNKTPIEMVSLYYGAFFRIGACTDPIKAPYGSDNGYGLGGGLVFGVDIQDLYIGLESAWIYKPVTGPFNDTGDDAIWKNGIMIQQLFDIGNAGLFCNFTTGFGTFKNKDSSITQSIVSNIRSMDIGASASFYLGETTFILGVEGGTVIYPTDGFESMFKDSSIFYPYVKACFTWVI